MSSHPLHPRFWPVHLVGLIAVGAAVGLGLWQLDTWQDKRTAEAVDRTAEQPVPLDEALGPDEPYPVSAVGQPVVVSGTWLPEATFFVDRRPDPAGGDEEGYWVVTPLQVSDEEGTPGSALLVVRGWAETPSAEPPAAAEADALVAWLQPGEETGAVDEDPTDDVYPQVRVADAVPRVDVDLYGAYAVLDHERSPAAEVADASAGLVAATPLELPDTGRLTALRNLLYGLEWWVFAGFAAFVWWRYLRDQRTADPEPVAAG